MNQEDRYRKLLDDTTCNLSGPEAPLCIGVGNAPNVSAPPTFEMDETIVNNVRRTKRLATVEMVLSCLILAFGVITTGMYAHISHEFYIPPLCMGTGIWVAILGIITAGLGLGAVRNGKYNTKCLLVSHFVMCIISAVASGILIIFTCICLQVSYRRIDYMYYDRETCEKYHYRCISIPGFAETIFAVEIVTLVGAIAHMIASIVSAAFICRYWCGGKGGAGTTVMYIANQGGSGNGPMQTITIPGGAQIVFVPPNVAVGPTPANVPIAP